MADIREIIWEKYQIDIGKENLIKLYDLENKENITEVELRQILAAKKAEWEKNTMNLTLESARKKLQDRLEKTKCYEEILLNKKYRNALFVLSRNGGLNQDFVEYAKTYFRIVATTKKIKRDDVDFFFAYSRIDNKIDKDTRDAILKFLQEEYKYSNPHKKKGRGKEQENEEIEFDSEMQMSEENADRKSGQKEESTLIVNLFSRETVMEIHSCEVFLEKSFEVEKVREKMQMKSASLYAFLKMDQQASIEQFAGFVEEKRNQIFKLKQEYGNEYTELVKMMNKLTELVKQADVKDNYQEFCLLVKYSKLTPFMYAFVEMKQSTIKQFLSYAQSCYFFRDMNDFIFNYFSKIYDNFGVNIQTIRPLIKNAEKSATKNKVLNEVNKRLGIDNAIKMPFWVNLMHWLVYLPIYLFFYLFEALKYVFTYMKYLALPVGAGLFGYLQYIFSQVEGMGNVTKLLLIFDKEKWINYISGYGMTGENGMVVVIFTIIVWLSFFVCQFLAPILVGMFVYNSAGHMSKRIDWIGYDRTIKRILRWLKQRTEKMYFERRKQWISDVIKRLIVNLIGYLVIWFLFLVIGNILLR